MSSEEIGKGIRALRVRSGLSQVEFGRLIGASGRAVHYWESGKRRPRLQYILRMSYTFNCDVGEIVGGYRHE